MDPKQLRKLGRQLRCQFVTGLSTLLLISFPLIWGSLRPGGLLQKEQAVYQLLYCDKSLGRAKGCFIGQADVTISKSEGYEDHQAGEGPWAEIAKAKPEMPATHQGKDKRPHRACQAYELVYVYDVPSKFNADILGGPCLVRLWSQHPRNACDIYAPDHGGIGPRLTGDEVAFLDGIGSPVSSWADTGQFALEVMFHQYMVDSYPCRTDNPLEAAAFYVPFYSGMAHADQSIDCTSRPCPDMSPLESMGHRLGAWLNQQPFLKRYAGRDHLTAVGRTSWDVTQPFSCCNTGLLMMDHTRNMVIMSIESTDRTDLERQVSVPYPTCFHPGSASELAAQQQLLLSSPRSVLVSFVGQLEREGLGWGRGLRAALKAQCEAHAAQCALLPCDMECPCTAVLAAQLRAKFCLQPSGDSPTRRSLFDALQAGCIPVLFHRQSAYDEYTAFLPEDEGSYSVFFQEDDVIAGRSGDLFDFLGSIPESELDKKRQVIAGMLSSISYADHHRATLDSRLQRTDSLEWSEFPIREAREMSAYGVAVTEALKRIERLGLGNIADGLFTDPFGQ